MKQMVNNLSLSWFHGGAGEGGSQEPIYSFLLGLMELD